MDVRTLNQAQIVAGKPRSNNSIGVAKGRTPVLRKRSNSTGTGWQRETFGQRHLSLPVLKAY